MNLYISDIVKDMDEQIINEMFSNFESESMSDERIRTMVFENINGKANDKSGKKRLSPKKIIVIAIAAALGLGGVAGATYLGQKNLRKNEVLSEENQRFVGTEVQGEYRPPAKMGDAPPTWEEIQKEMEERVRSQTDIIEDHSEFFGGMIPSGATEIIIEKRGENAYVYPEQILVNGAVSILKREEKRGGIWTQEIKLKLHF